MPLFLSFRPDDPNCQPLGARKRPCAGILLRCKRRKGCSRGEEEEAGGKEDSCKEEGGSSGVEQALEADVVGTVDFAVEFCGEQTNCDFAVLQQSCDVGTYVVAVIWLVSSHMIVM